MCRSVQCNVCEKMTWVGCGAHIDQALSGYSIEERCKGWKTGECPGLNSADTSGAINCSTIEDRIRKGFKSVHHLDVKDMSDGCGSKFKIILVSDDFNGVRLIERHRMVNGDSGVLAGIMSNVHAMEMKTWTLEQYEKKMAKANA